MSKKKTHEFTIKLRFNKPCTKREALYHAKNHIFGKEYIDTFQFEDGGPDIMYIGAIKHNNSTILKALKGLTNCIDDMQCQGMLSEYTENFNKTYSAAVKAIVQAGNKGGK